MIIDQFAGGSAASSVACPACSRPFPWPPRGACHGCGAVLDGPVAAQIFDIDRRAHALAATRTQQVDLLAGRGGPPPVPSAAAAGAVPSPSSPAHPAGPPARPPVVPPDVNSALWGPPQPALPMATLLAWAGAGLLAVAAIVFTAVAWPVLPTIGKALVLAATTGGAAVAADRLSGRLPIAGGGLGLVAVAMVAVDVLAPSSGGVISTPVDSLVWLALGAAAVAGEVLSRRGIEWVGPIGAISAVAASVAVAGVLEARGAAASSAGVAAAALLVSLVVPRLKLEASRVIAGIGLSVTSVVAGLSGLFFAAANARLVAAGTTSGFGTLLIGQRPSATAVVVGSVAWALAVGQAVLTTGRSREAVIAVAALVASVPVAIGFGLALAPETIVLLVAIELIVLTSAWVALAPAAFDRLAGLAAVGAGVHLAAVAGLALVTMGAAVARIAQHMLELDPFTTSVTATATALLVLVAAAVGVAITRPHRGLEAGLWAASGAVVVAVVWAPAVAAYLCAAAALVIALVAALVGRRDEEFGEAAGPAWVVLIVAAFGWAVGDPTALVLVGLATGVAAVVAAIDGGGVGRLAPLVIAPSAGIAAFGLLAPVGDPGQLVGIAGVVVVAIAAGVVAAWPGHPATAGLAVVAVAAPALSGGSVASGVICLAAAVAWLIAAVRGVTGARWLVTLWSAVASALLVGDTDVEVIEAYTALPALTALGAGLWWMADDERVSSIRALAPGLSLAIGPSVLALLNEPDGLARLAAVVVLACVAAGVGVSSRLAAPIVAGALAAAGIGLSQLPAVADIVPRWLLLATGGGLLLTFAATYEQAVARVGEVRGRLADLR